MAKISKKDQDLTREEEEAQRSWASKRPKSQHFAVGTDVICKNKRGTVINEMVLTNCVMKLIKWHEGGLSHLRRPL